MTSICLRTPTSLHPPLPVLSCQHLVRPLSVFVSCWLNTVDAERKRNDHSVDGTKTAALRNVEGRKFSS